MQKLIFTSESARELDSLVASAAPAGVCLLVDSNTRRCVLPRLLKGSAAASQWPVIEIEPGEDHKNIETVTRVWTELQRMGATRHWLMVNVGGGLVTDLGGFAASTFKRGMDFVNMPTTLLGAVDAAVGGKTGVNFGGLKNEVGVFREASAVIISTCFFNTLPADELASGYAEMLKHGYLKGGDAVNRLLDFDIAECRLDTLLDLLRESVEVKSRIVVQDPTEKGLRKALNLGHTAGHAFEALAIERGSHLPHGHAVAAGMVVALVLSHMLEGYPSEGIYALARYVGERYTLPRFTCDDYPRLIGSMKHDKKLRRAGQLNFTLLKAPGMPVTDCEVSDDDLRTALDLTRDLLHI